MPRVGIIGGSGVYKVMEERKSVLVNTPFGNIEVFIGTLGGEEVAFIPRHGKKHEVPPFKVNYRGNLYALMELGVERVLATNAVGALREEYPPGTLLIPDDFIDFTKTREYTYYDGREIKVRDKKIKGVVHVSMTPDPYCPEIRQAMLRAADEMGLEVVNGGVYCCMEGNRFETPAEIRALRTLGGDVVGMTGCPEAALARELEMCYATVNVITNYAAGVRGNVKLTQEEVAEIFSERIKDVISLIERTIPLIPKRGPVLALEL